MFGLGLPELIIIAVILGILFFGGDKISNLARSLGKFNTEFKKAKVEAEDEFKQITTKKTASKSPPKTTQSKKKK